MKKLIISLLLCLPLTVSASYMDVIEVELNDDCSFDEYMAIVKDFNADWAPGTGYSSRVAVPLQGDDLDSIFWVGETKDAATFGAAWDKWRNEQGDPDSVAAKLGARFGACSTNEKRWGYDVY